MLFNDKNYNTKKKEECKIAVLIEADKIQATKNKMIKKANCSVSV